MFRFCCFIVCGLLLAGCFGGKSGQGKFSDEEMAAFGMAKRSDLPGPSGGLVFSVGGEPITLEEVIVPLEDKLVAMPKGDRFQAEAEPLIARVVRNKAIDILIYKAAKSKAPPNIEELLEKEVEREVNTFVASYGGNLSEAQAAIETLGMDWQAFRDFQKKYILTQSYMSQKFSKPGPVSLRESQDFYEANKSELFAWDAAMDFDLIDISADRLEVDGVSAEEAEQAAFRIAGELADRVRGGEDFGEIAKEYSHGHNASKGGKWGVVKLGEFAPAYEVLEVEAKKSASGDIVGPIKSGRHVFVMKLNDIREAGHKPFEEVKMQIERHIILSRQNEEYNKVMLEVASQANVAGLERFTELCIYEAYQRYGKN